MNSSIVMYVLQESTTTETPHLKQLWQVSAGQDPLETEDQSSNVVGGNDTELRSHGNKEEGMQHTGRDYNYGDAFVMAEITPAGNVIAVEERQDGNSFIQLFSPEGKCLGRNKVEGSSITGGCSQQFHTLFISSYKNGCYAIGVQGGTVVLVHSETLKITSSFNVVSQYSIPSYPCFHIFMLDSLPSCFGSSIIDF